MSPYETWFYYHQLISEEENCSGEEIIPTFTCNVYINSCNQENLRFQSEVQKPEVDIKTIKFVFLYCNTHLLQKLIQINNTERN
jgi:hypothetical protein